MTKKAMKEQCRKLIQNYKDGREFQDDFKVAARKAVSEDVKDYKQRLFFTPSFVAFACEICGKEVSIETSHLDHCPISFNTIVENFIKDTGIKVSKVEFNHDKYGVEFKHDSMKESFREYHNSRAEYRILCKPCNLKYKP